MRFAITQHGRFAGERSSCAEFAQPGSEPPLGLSNLEIWLLVSKVIDSLAVGYPFSIVHLPEFENRRRIIFK
jgi:hypothetical protein